MIRTSIIKAFSLRGILFAATGDCGQILNAVWSSSSFSTIGGRGGNHHGSSEGFALLKEDGGQAFPIQLPEGADCQPGVTGIKATLNPQPMRGGILPNMILLGEYPGRNEAMLRKQRKG